MKRRVVVAAAAWLMLSGGCSPRAEPDAASDLKSAGWTFARGGQMDLVDWPTSIQAGTAFNLTFDVAVLDQTGMDGCRVVTVARPPEDASMRFVARGQPRDVKPDPRTVERRATPGEHKLWRIG